MTEIDSMKILKERSVKRNKMIYLCLVILFIQGCGFMTFSNLNSVWVEKWF